MEKEPHHYNKPDDLDLVTLIERGLIFLKSSWKMLVLFTLLGLALGLLRYSTSPKLYTSRLLLHSIILTNQEEIEMIDMWNKLLGKGEHKTLATSINCDESMLKQLKKISAEEIQKLYIQNNPNGFAVDAWVTDTSVLYDLENAIVNGLSNSGYVKGRVETRKARFEEMIKNVKIEIAKLEVTKTTVDSIISHSAKGSSPLLVDISSLNAQWIGLNEKLLSYQEELKFSNAVQVLHGFNKPEKPIGPSLVKNIVFGLIGGAFIGYLVAIFNYFRQKIRSRSGMRLVRRYEQQNS